MPHGVACENSHLSWFCTARNVSQATRGVSNVKQDTWHVSNLIKNSKPIFCTCIYTLSCSMPNVK